MVTLPSCGANGWREHHACVFSRGLWLILQHEEVPLNDTSIQAWCIWPAFPSAFMFMAQSPPHHHWFCCCVSHSFSLSCPSTPSMQSTPPRTVWLTRSQKEWIVVLLPCYKKCYPLRYWVMLAELLYQKTLLRVSNSRLRNLIISYMVLATLLFSSLPCPTPSHLMNHL